MRLSCYYNFFGCFYKISVFKLIFYQFLNNINMDPRVGKKYKLGRKIGSGAFGDIYLGSNVVTGI